MAGVLTPMRAASFPPHPVTSSIDPNDWPEELVYDNHVYDPAIRTVQCYPSDAQLSEPYLLLGSDGILELHFDDLNADYRDLYFTLIHCTHDWQPSDLESVAYMNGFAENSISDIEDSFNTMRGYTHYSAQFPNDMSSVSLSGNYLLVVYEDADPTQLVLSRRMVVYERLVTVATNVREATAVEDARYRQELDFEVHHPGFDIINPYTDFHVALLQNNRWDNAITDLQPRFVKGTELSYDYSRENNFDGGNEWRAIDTKSLGFKSYEIDSIGIWQGDVHCWVKAFGRRSFKQYRTQGDIEGKFFVKNDDAGDSNLEAEYVFHHFRLPYDVEMTHAEVYVFGALSDFQTQERFKMHYNPASRSYELEVMLKQGFTNYQYAVVEHSAGVVDLAMLEGSHRQTHNIYTVFAYNWDQALGYDRVIGAAFTNTFNR